MTSTMLLEKVTGVILAGGKSSRFGANKALAVLDGSRLIEHPATTLQTIFAKLLLVTNTPEEYNFLGWPMTKDRFPGAGPLGGIHAALKSAHTAHIFVAACDMPLLQPTLIRFLCKQREDWDAVLPWTTKGPEPLCAVYAKSILPLIEKALESDELRVKNILKDMRIRRVTTAELAAMNAAPETFTNINRQDDLSGLQNMASDGQEK